MRSLVVIILLKVAGAFQGGLPQRRPRVGVLRASAEPWALSELLQEIDKGAIAKARFLSETTIEATDLADRTHDVTVLLGNHDDVLGALKRNAVPLMVDRGGLQELPFQQALGAALGFAVNVLPFAVVGWLLLRRFGGGGDPTKPTDDEGNPLHLLEARKKISVAESEVSFGDVAGCEQAKLELAEVVDFLKSPEKYAKVGAKTPKGVLLEGPPGTGKTLLARAVAGEAGVPFVSTSGSQFVELFVGVGAARIRSLFDEAKKRVPCIVFIDEIDAVGRQRSGASGLPANDEREATLNQILKEMDGFTGHTGVIVLAATNRPDILDTALLRPGRFDRRVWLDLPDRDGRVAILKVHVRGKPLQSDVDLEDVASRTVGASGAELKNVCNEAAVFAARRRATKIAPGDFEKAIDRVTVGLEGPATATVTASARRLVAYHEAGHAVAGLLAGLDRAVAKVTLVTRAGDWGMTIFKPGGPEDDVAGTFRSLAALRKDLLVALGGRVAEELVFGKDEVTTRSSRDLQRIRILAHDMVERWGFASDVLATTAWLPADSSPELYTFPPKKHFASEHTERQIDDAVAALIHEAYTNCKVLIAANRAFLDAVVEDLLDHESLDANHLDGLMTKYHPTPLDALLPPETKVNPPAEPVRDVCF